MGSELLVLLGGDVIGSLAQDQSGDLGFRYLPEYVDSGAPALSAGLPLSQGPYVMRKIEPFLAGLLPENQATRQAWARTLGTQENDTFAILSKMGWDCPGAVQFCLPEDLDKLVQRESSYRLVREDQIAARLRNLAADSASWTMPDEHWSLGGQQEKFALAYVDGKWFEALGASATTHIFKPGIRHLSHQAIVEHATMRAAASLGVNVAESQLACFEDQWAIVVSRFDRTVACDGHVVRRHQEDFCQALVRLPERKYESMGGPTLRDMTLLILRESTNVHEDLLALADSAIINVVAGAPDGHSKNISMTRLPRERVIAPLYDLATGLVYDSSDVERTVALSIGGERMLSRIYRKQWEKAAATMGLGGEAVLGRVAQLASEFPDAFRAALVEIGHVPGAEEIAERAEAVIGEHCNRLLTRITGP